MYTTTEQENSIKSGLYSPRQLFITSAIGGPAIAGFIYLDSEDLQKSNTNIL